MATLHNIKDAAERRLERADRAMWDNLNQETALARWKAQQAFLALCAREAGR